MGAIVIRAHGNVSPSIHGHAWRDNLGYVANLLGEDEDWLHELSIDMFPEDGCLRVYGVAEDGVTAFTRDGIECLQQIIADEPAARRAPPQVKPTE